MSTTLRPYQPSEKGRELIAILFPLAAADRLKNIQAFHKQYPKEIGAVIDGFHFLVQEIIEARNVGETSDRIAFPDDFFQAVFKGMKDLKVFFSYRDIQDFLAALSGVKPPVFSNPEQVQSSLKKVLSDLPVRKSDFAFPDTFDDQVRNRLTTICREVSVAYENTVMFMPSIRNAQKTIEAFQDVSQEITLMDVKLAKATADESRTNFDLNAKVIAKHWPYVYEVYTRYVDNIEVLQIYINYLAKLLASREARYPAENYVLMLAGKPFPEHVPEFKPTQLQLQRGITSLSLTREYLQELKTQICRLESRYRKRKLMVKLKENTPKAQVIQELMEISQTDPVDIKTHILLARMFGEYAITIKDHQKRTSMREQALKYCNLAFSRIDDYLDLQQIEKMKERDQIRAGFVKTISAIRIPLLKSKG